MSSLTITNFLDEKLPTEKPTDELQKYNMDGTHRKNYLKRISRETYYRKKREAIAGLHRKRFTMAWDMPNQGEII